MFKKTLTTDFLSTINFKLALKSFSLLTIKLPTLRYWNYIDILENEILSYLWLTQSKIISFYNWRSALFNALKIIWIEKNDEVIVNWYTCVSVSNAVIQSWAKIIYSDINKENLWFDLKDLEKKISSKTKIIIVQHTFWKPSYIEEIIKIAQKNKIILIEDCAHSLWTKIISKKLWSYWDFSIFSTWRDKVISSVTWWFLVINDEKYFYKAEEIEKLLKMPSRTLTIRNLMYNIVAYKTYFFYDFIWLWKFIIYISKKIWLITNIINEEEKNCWYNKFNYKLPNSLAELAVQELQKIKTYNNHRRLIADYYNDTIKNHEIKIVFEKIKWEKNNYFRYPILLESEEKAKKLYKYMRKHKIILWNSWSWLNIVPKWIDLWKCNYKWDCKNAEEISNRILTLPNHNFISIDNAIKVVKLLNNFKI